LRSYFSESNFRLSASFLKFNYEISAVPSFLRSSSDGIRGVIGQANDKEGEGKEEEKEKHTKE
jgi:hypothetical protein